MGSSLVDPEAEKVEEIQVYQELKKDPDHQKGEDVDMKDQIDSNPASYKLQKQAIVKIVCNSDSGYLNEYTGAGSVVTNCKHHSHLSCLRKYYLEQTSQEGQYNKKLTGFSSDEFSCPICKSINNSIVPIYSFRDFELELQLDPQDQGEALVLSDQDIGVMEFYVDYFAQVAKKQQGFLCKRDLGDAIYQ